MYTDYNQYPFLVNIKQDVNAIAAEYEAAVEKLDFLKEFARDTNPTIHNHVDFWIKENKFHPDDIGYEAREGVWASFPIYKIGFPIGWYNVNDHFPNIMKHLKSVPNLYFSSFMRLDSGAKTMPHKHLMKNCIFHLLLNDLDKPCVFNVNGQEKSLQKKGDCLLFNYSDLHSSINYASVTRVTFIVDFDPLLFNAGA